MRPVKTSKEQLEHVKDWERRNPGRAQARKNNWFASEKGLAWIKKNQKRRNAKRKLWRAKKRRDAKAANAPRELPEREQP